MQLTYVSKELLRQQSIIHLPKIAQSPYQASIHIDEKFLPVLKNKKYNIIKLKELRQLHQREVRRGRFSSMQQNYKIRQEQNIGMTSSNYLSDRKKNKRVLNGSFVSMNQKIKESTRYYWPSLQK